MNIEDLIGALNRKAVELENLIRGANLRIESSPPGSIRVKKERGVTRFYWVNGSETGNVEYLGRDKSELRGKLSQKMFNKLLLGASKQQLKAVLKCVDVLDGVEDKRDGHAIMEDMASDIKGFVADAFEDDDERYAKRWQAKDFGTWYNCMSVHTTRKMENVRSKSEVLIADRLLAKGVPYHYESVFECYDGTHVNPDFRVLNKRTRKEFFWEHLGRMDDPQYCAHCVDKIEKYSRSGVVLGRNLIITMESSLRPMSTWFIDQTIHDFLL